MIACASFPDVVKWNYIWKGGVLHEMDTAAGRRTRRSGRL